MNSSIDSFSISKNIAQRILDAHQLDPLHHQVSPHQLAFLGIGDHLIDTTRAYIPTAGNHALSASEHPDCVDRLEKVRQTIDWILVTSGLPGHDEKGRLHYARIVQAAARVARTGGCNEFAHSVFADAVIRLPAFCTIQIEADEDIDHCWVKISAPGVESIVLDAWTPMATAVLERHYSYYSSKGPAQPQVMLRCQGRRDPDTQEEDPAEESSQEDLEATAAKAFLAVQDAPSSKEPCFIRISSTVTATGRPMVYFA